MARLTVYLSDEIEERVRTLAQAEGVSINKWISSQISRAARASWSPEFLAAAGADPDFPDPRPTRFGADAFREKLK